MITTFNLVTKLLLKKIFHRFPVHIVEPLKVNRNPQVPKWERLNLHIQKDTNIDHAPLWRDRSQIVRSYESLSLGMIIVRISKVLNL
jgi:hypothetical protein